MQAARCELAAAFLDDLRRIDAQLRETRKKLAVAVAASGSSLTGLFGVGPVIAAAVIGWGRLSAGSMHRYLASDEETAGSIRPPRRVFPPANLLSHRLPDLIVVSDFGSRMGAAMSAQARLDAVIVAVGRFLASLDIAPVTGRPVLSS